VKTLALVYSFPPTVIDKSTVLAKVALGAVQVKTLLLDVRVAGTTATEPNLQSTLLVVEGALDNVTVTFKPPTTVSRRTLAVNDGQVAAVMTRSAVQVPIIAEVSQVDEVLHQTHLGLAASKQEPQGPVVPEQAYTEPLVGLEY
jgi:hypothetical protein